MKYSWTMVCDFDEFIYSRNGYNTVADYLNTVDLNVSQIAISWKIFGSNGHKEAKEPDSAINAFTKRTDYAKGVSDIKKVNCKCIVRNSKLIDLGIHHSTVRSGLTIQSNNVITQVPFVETNEIILNTLNLHLNHYVVRSFDWFSRIKMTRGDVNTAKSDNVRNINYYNAYDINDIDDLELKNKKY
jgi:hypothetical protein